MITGVQAHKLCSYDTLRARRTVICISLRVSRKQGNAKRGKGKWRGGTEGGTESKSHRQHGRTMQKKSESVYALTDKQRERQKERERVGEGASGGRVGARESLSLVRLRHWQMHLPLPTFRECARCVRVKEREGREFAMKELVAFAQSQLCYRYRDTHAYTRRVARKLLCSVSE